MKKNTQIEELKTTIKHLTARIEMLEKGERPKFKKLRERKEAPKAETKQVKQEKKVAKSKKNPVIVNLQKKAIAMKEKMTKKQLAAYEKSWSTQWQKINKSIDKDKKEERSMAFAKGRIECAKNAIKMF